MLRDESKENYLKWWEYWISKLPQNCVAAAHSTSRPLKRIGESTSDRAPVFQRLRLNCSQRENLEEWRGRGAREVFQNTINDTNVNPDIEATGNPTGDWED